RSQRVARVDRHVRDRPALQPLGWPPPALRIDVAPRIAVLLRVGVDDATDGPVLLRELGFQAAPAFAIAGDDDLALDIDAVTRENLVIIGHAVVDVDEIARDIAIGPVDVVRSHAVRSRGSGIARHRRLL